MTVATSDVALFANTDLWLANNDNAASQLRFYESKSGSGDFPNGANYSSFEAQGQTVDIEYLLPATVPATLPANDEVLAITAIAGSQVTLSWVDNTTLASDRRKKENFLLLSGEDVLKEFETLELGSWNYNGEQERHYGIMAQDFYEAFGGYDSYGEIGTDTTVSVIDLHGISIYSHPGIGVTNKSEHQASSSESKEIKELKEESVSREEFEQLKKENAKLRSEVSRLHNLEDRLKHSKSKCSRRVGGQESRVN